VLIGVALAVSCRAEIDIEGVPKAIKEELVNELKEIQIPCELSVSQRNRIEKKTDIEVKQVLEAWSYFSATWQNTFLTEKSCWQLAIDITLGKPLQIRKAEIRIEGAASDSPYFKKILATSGLQPNSPFDSEKYENLKSKIQASGLRHGFFDAEFIAQRVHIYPSIDTVDIELIWNSGERYRYGEITIDQSVLDPQLFQHYLTIKTGDFYDLSIVQNDRSILRETRYFEIIELKPLIDQRKNQKIPIKIYATPGRIATYRYGIGFATDSGVRLLGKYTRNRLNERGHKQRINLLLSPIETTLNYNYFIPWKNPKIDSLQTNVSYITEDTDSYKSERFEGSLTSSVIRPSGWTQSFSALLTTERSELGRDSEVTTHFVPSVSVSKIETDNLIYPSHGYKMSFTLLVSPEKILSDSKFIQLKGAVKYINTLPYNLRLIMRGEMGVTAVDTVDELPASWRFFAGGDSSIRGYDYQSLGPTVDGKVVGGRYLATASVELQRMVYKKWSLATFIDAGNAWDFGKIDLVTSVGVGLHWLSPIGSIRLDIGFPLQQTDSDYRIHFSFGPEL
jgi:translocation and assembly module TamA